jgi:hypothetical protein
MNKLNDIHFKFFVIVQDGNHDQTKLFVKTILIGENFAYLIGQVTEK